MKPDFNDFFGSKARSKQKELNNLLLKAAKAGDVLAIEQALKDGAKIEAYDSEFERNALHWAATQGYADVINVLLKAGANVDARDKYKNTPLHWAAPNGHNDVAKILLEAGAEVNAVNAQQVTPLHGAASGDSISTAKILLAAGADHTLRNNRQDRPIDYAIEKTALAAYLQDIADYATPRPTPESVGLDMVKRIAALDALGKPLGQFTQAELMRKQQRETREAQRLEALNKPYGGI